MKSLVSRRKATDASRCAFARPIGIVYRNCADCGEASAFDRKESVQAENHPLGYCRPQYEGASASIFQTYRKGDRAVELYLGHYRQQHKGAELVTSTNVMIQQKHPVWAKVGESSQPS